MKLIWKLFNLLFLTTLFVSTNIRSSELNNKFELTNTNHFQFKVKVELRNDNLNLNQISNSISEEVNDEILNEDKISDQNTFQTFEMNSAQKAEFEAIPKPELPDAIPLHVQILEKKP